MHRSMRAPLTFGILELLPGKSRTIVRSNPVNGVLIFLLDLHHGFKTKGVANDEN